MSDIKYNNLLFELSESLNRLNLCDRLLFLCRGKLTPGSEDRIQDALSLFKELEDCNHLGPDRLGVLKTLLKGLNEYVLLENVKRFENDRKEYLGLLDKIIPVLDELDDVERLISICRADIPEAHVGNICNVRSLIKELENNSSLGTDSLGILKEILLQTEQNDLLRELEKFEERRNREEAFQTRKERASAFLSSVGSMLIGVMNIKTVFKVVAGGMITASTLDVWSRGASYDQLVTAVNKCVLPAGTKLIQITEGCVCLTVQADGVSALKDLWSLYQSGTLKARLQGFFVTDHLRELAQGEQVEAIVTIDEQEFDQAFHELNRREKDVTYALCLKDLSEPMLHEMSLRLQANPVYEKWFLQSFGLHHERSHPSGLLMNNIKKSFPDTPVKHLSDVFDALQLYDIVELLEKLKPRQLRPALSLQEMQKLPRGTRGRPTTFYSKALVLIVHDGKNAKDDAVQRIGSFFKTLDSRCDLTAISSAPLTDKHLSLMELKRKKNLRRETLVVAQSYMPPRLESVSEKIEVVERQVTNAEEELESERREIEVALSKVVDKIRQQEEDMASTLFALFDFSRRYTDGDESYPKLIDKGLANILENIPNAVKVVITGSRLDPFNEIPEALYVVYETSGNVFAVTLLGILSKRWQTLDLVSIMQEVERELSFGRYNRPKITHRDSPMILKDRLSVYVRLRKADDTTTL
ncbi:uncharacterized protein [Montipora foliosa]|uniref:uncharacterized protein n=1 Tax=Montipora foliosa TaxID=591990 RepID=UPI0035F123B5